MNFVPDHTELAGFYECEECGYGFLSTKIMPRVMCPACGEFPDMEIGPDDEMPDAAETAKLLEVIEGEENVEKYDTLLDLAISGGDYKWL